jgi:hypothetical protein
MYRTVVVIAVAWGMGLGSSAVHAQATTERFIPVGQSPGLSGVSTYLGQVVSVDPGARTVTVRNDAVTRTIALTGETRVWLDRSRLRERNTIGTAADLQAGRTVEIKYADPDTRQRAEWVKVVIEG